jgi:autotransporter-associated beta strand protein
MAKRWRRSRPSRPAFHRKLLAIEPLEQRLVLNAAPVLDPTASPELMPVEENAGPPVGAVGTPVSALIDSGGPLNNFSDADGDLPGIAITGVNLQGGKLWYSVNGGVTWSDVGEVSDAEPKLLTANSLNRVFFETVNTSFGLLDDVVTFRAWDQHGVLEQLGGAIFGEAADDSAGSSVSLSADGSIIAIGASSNDGNGISAGHVRLYRWSGIGWEQLGGDIDGAVRFEASGAAVSLAADGRTVAIGAANSGEDGSSPGRVRIYRWSGAAWGKLGGDIDGEVAGDRSGFSVSLSADGTTVAIGAIHNSGYRTSAGHVRLYRWSGTAWEQLGEDIDGEARFDRSGWSVSLAADGRTVAIGTVSDYGDSADAGHVQLYRWSGRAWEQLGEDIDGEVAGDRSGWSVSLSADGSTVAIGAAYNDGNGADVGHVRLYQWSGTAWEQLGGDIDGEAAGDRSGWSVSLSADGNTVAIGAINNDGSAAEAGHVRLHRWSGIAWEQLGGDIDGEAAGDRSGSSVSLSADGRAVAISAPGNDGNGTNSGHVRLYRFSPTTTSFSASSDTISVNVFPVANVASGQTRTDDNTYSGDVTLIKTGGGTLILNKANTHTGGLRVEEGTVIIQHVDALNGGPLVVNAGARVLIDIGTSLVPLSSLSLDAAANLDVGEGGFTVSNGGLTEAHVRQALIDGRNGGAWDAATGITHSSASDSRAVGYRVDGGGALTVRQTLAGDVDLDGDVDFDDILGLFPNYGTTTGMVWYGGDITYDDAVDFDDILALFPNYGNGAAFGSAGASSLSSGGGSGQSTSADTADLVMGPTPPADHVSQKPAPLYRNVGSGGDGLDATTLAFAALVSDGGGLGKGGPFTGGRLNDSAFGSADAAS